MNKRGPARDLTFAVFILGLFIFGLNVPKISTAIILLISLLGVVRGGLLKRLNLGFLIRSGLLLLFSLTYYLTLYSYTFVDFGDSVRNILLIICLYSFGYSIRSSEIPGGLSAVVWIFVSMVAGFVVFSFISVKEASALVDTLVIMGRGVPSFWVEGDLINGTVIGMFASLGMCLVPVILFGRERDLRVRGFIFIAFAISLLVIMGVYVNIILQNRSPYVALMLSLLFSGYIYFVIKKAGVKYKIIKILLIGLIFGVCGFLLFYTTEYFLLGSLTRRFQEMGIRSDRYESWELLIRSLFTYPMGGREAFVGGYRYVHNLWLDVGYSAGILPLVLLLLFHVSHLKSFMVLIRSRLPLLIIICITALGVSILVGFMVEPVLEASVTYFSVSCFFFAMIKSLSVDVKSSFYRNDKII